ncbi:hypothetical protein [Ramlibacter sp.]|uniref:hypothetical protein n=1 Tax=Ramlibacter sp. TaxID=1917967 RepID=UPI003D12CE59
MTFAELLAPLQQATLAARKRTADAAIGTRVEAGRFQVVRVTYPDGKNGHVEPLSGWLTMPKAVDHLNSL